MPDCCASDLRGGEHAGSAQVGGEGVDQQAVRQVVAHGGLHVEDALRRVGVAVGHGG